MSCCLSAASTLMYLRQTRNSSQCAQVMVLVSGVLELAGMIGSGPGLFGTMNGVADSVASRVGDTVRIR